MGALSPNITMQRALDRIRAEFLEMPGLQLTIEQVHRLCGIERGICSDVLDVLVEEDFLYMKADGRYSRVTSDAPRPRPAKARLSPSHSKRTA